MSQLHSQKSQWVVWLPGHSTRSRCGLRTMVDVALTSSSARTPQVCSRNLCNDITHSHGSATVLYGRRRKSIWKPENRPLDTTKPLNTSSPKVAYVIRSWIPTIVQNLVTIHQSVSFPRMREIARRKCLLGFFFPGSSNAPTAQALEPIFSQNAS